MTLIWNPSPDTNVIGYAVYYGVASRNYTNRIDVGFSTNAVINGLKEGTTYYFAATAYNILGMESDYSAEISYLMPAPGNAQPTLNAIASLTLNEDAGTQTVNLSGISSGGETQNLTVTAISSNPALIPNPAVNYNSPNSTGALTFSPAPNGYGTATIMVTVNDGGVTNNLIARQFTVTVNPVNDAPTLNAIANVSINEDSGLRTVALAGISSGAANEAQTLVVSATSSNPGLIPNPTVAYTSPGTSGSLAFTPVANANGTATITVTVNDGAAANNLVTRTFTVSVSASNDAPTLNAIANVSISQNAGLQTVTLGGISSGAANEVQTLAITAISSNPALIPNPAVNYTSPNATGSLTFTPVANAFGVATITVTVNDGAAANNVATRTFVVTVGAVNQQPTLNAIANLTINEDAGQQTVPLAGISSGAANESQTLTVTATSSNPGLIPNPAVNYTSPNATGSLTFTPVANAYGTATISVSVNDGGSTNNLLTRTFTVSVNASNDAPTLNAIANVSISQNAGLQTVALAGISSGAANEVQTLAITAISSNPALIPNPAVNYTSPNATGSLTFTPVANAFGVATITVTVNDGAAANNVATRTFVVAVGAVNQQPTLNAIANLTINEDAGQQTVPLAGISSGAANESQTLTVTATSSNPGLIPNPAVNYTSPNATGSLTFTPAANAYGTATISVSVNDGGSTNNLLTRTFTVSVNSVNDAPTLNAIANISVMQNSGSQSVTLSGIGSGSVNESQTLAVTATSSNPGLIPNPVVSYTSPNASGSLSFSPAANMSGTATITVSVNDGGATNGVVTRTFVVTVDAINQPPTLDAIANLTIPRSAGLQTIDLSGIGSGSSGENQTLTVTAVSSDTSLIPNPTVNYISPNSTGRLTFTPVPSATGVGIITVRVNDGASTNNLAQRVFTVTVDSPPVIGGIANQTIGVNSNTAPLLVVVNDRETDAADLKLSAQSSAPALIPTNNVVFGGAGSNRTVRVTPVAGQSGSALITISVTDGISSASTSFQVTVLAPPAAPRILTIVTNGAGTVSGISSSTALAVGKSYTLTAVPKEGQQFAGWSGSITSSLTRITFTAKSNMVLQANFVPTPYRAGTYNGLLYEDDGIQIGTSGNFRLQVTRGGKYTGQLIMGAKRYRIGGQFGLNCLATNTILRPRALPLVVTWELGVGDGDEVIGQLAVSNSICALRGDRAVFSKTNTAPFAGAYTLALPGSDGGELLEPVGHGYGTFSVSSVGLAKFSGVLADGAKVTQSATISKNGHWPFYAALSKRQGAAISWLSFTNRSADDVNGLFTWLRNPNARAKLYPAGIDVDVEAVGARVVLTPGTNILNAPLAAVEFSGGNLAAAFENSIQVSTNNRTLNLSTNYLSLSFNSKKGTFSGKVTVPGTKKAKKFSGVILQKAQSGYGFMVGTNQTSAVEISVD